MSSNRVALASSVLLLALLGGSWGATQAFPLYGQEPGAQAPPRDPMTASSLHRLAVEYQDKARQDTSLSEDEKLAAILKGISYEDRALERDPNYVDALVYKNILLRMQAAMTADAGKRQELTRTADELRDKAMALRKANPQIAPLPPPVPSTAAALSPDFDAHLGRLQPLRIGGNIKPPVKVRDVKPVYPPEAQANGVRGVVILETLIGEDGAVVDARILRSIAALDAAALDAVRQWRFAPVLVNGAAVPVLMTVTVNFTLQQ
jgi:TonB family protein